MIINEHHAKCMIMYVHVGQIKINMYMMHVEHVVFTVIAHCSGC